MHPTILVAESNADVRKLISDLLEAGGYRVETAGSVVTALSCMNEHPPEAVFVDIDLDGGGAGQFIDQIGAKERRIPCFLLVNAAMNEPDKSAVRLGATAYLEKPIDRNRLLSYTRIAVAQKKQCDEEMGRSGELALARRYLKVALDVAHESFFLLNEQGQLLECNEKGAELLHIDPEVDVGKRYLSLLSSVSADVQEEAFAAVRSSLEPQQIEEHRSKGIFTTTIRPVVEDGSVVGFVIVTRDITELRRSEVGLAESEKRYRSVYEAARDAIIMLDRNDGTILDCNAAARRLYGYSFEKMLSMTVVDLADDPEQAVEDIRSGVERIPLVHHRRQGGMTFPVEISMSHFVHDGREVSTAFVQDISHRTVVEEALREGARLYRAVVEDQTELICRYTPNGEMTFINGAYAKFFEVDEDEVVGKKLFSQLASDERRDVKSWLGQAGMGNTVYDREQLVQRDGGESRYILWTNRAVLDHRGKVLEIQAVGRDITDRKNAEHALGLATQEKEQYRLNLEATFRSIPDAIVTVDSQCRVIATNSAAEALLGIERELASGHKLDEVSDSESNPCVGVLKQVLRTSKSVRGFETELDVPEVGLRIVELNCTPLIDNEAQHAGAVLVVRDVSRIADLEKRLQERHGFRGIVGRSSVMQEIYSLLEQLSSLDSTVLILGESGTGKELVADALHYGGSRAGQPLVKVNCSALTESLLESELFGHVRGAFTGAVRDKVGRIQAAEGGTLFLDEIGDISPLLQLKLLRFLEQKEYERVGESKTRSADVRIIAATNVDLLEAVRRGIFREDLYYRLNVMPIPLPPLRDRQADIPLLVDHFLVVFSEQFKKTFTRAEENVMDLFMGYAWPGNVRELRHILEHACILSPGKEITLRHMRKDIVDRMRASEFVPQPLISMASGMMSGGNSATVSHGNSPTFYSAARKATREDILEALERCGGNKARAARQLGIHRATLYRKLKQWESQS